MSSSLWKTLHQCNLELTKSRVKRKTGDEMISIQFGSLRLSCLKVLSIEGKALNVMLGGEQKQLVNFCIRMVCEKAPTTE